MLIMPSQLVLDYYFDIVLPEDDSEPTTWHIAIMEFGFIPVLRFLVDPSEGAVGVSFLE